MIIIYVIAGYIILGILFWFDVLLFDKSMRKWSKDPQIIILFISLWVYWLWTYMQDYIEFIKSKIKI